MHAAAVRGHVDVVRFLVEEAGGDVAKADRDGNDVLMAALREEENTREKGCYFYSRLVRVNVVRKHANNNS